jgi:hypothetical protein
MRRLLLLAVVAATAFVWSVGAPAAEATPRNTVFDRSTTYGCDFEFQFGEFGGTPYATARHINGSPVGHACKIIGLHIWWVKGSASGDLYCTNQPSNQPSGTWYNCDYFGAPAGAVGWKAEFQTYDYNGVAFCSDSWLLRATIYDNLPEGSWVWHQDTC